MTLQVYEWYSYSCNNSSDHRLVAEFETDAKARAMGEELRAMFQAHAEQVDAAVEDGDDPDDLEPTSALAAFAEKYGVTLAEGITWGDGDAYVDDMPEVAVFGRTVYAYHGYMAGFGDLGGVLANAGAVQTDADNGAAWLQFAVTAVPGAAAALQTKIDAFIGQRTSKNNLNDWDCPWEGHALSLCRKLENVALVHDADRSTFTLAVRASVVADLLGWLASSGAATVTVKLTNDAEIEALRARDPLFRFRAVLVHRVGLTGWDSCVTQLHVDGTRMTLCGGAGSKNLLRVSTDGGATFEDRPLDVGNGLRCLLEEPELGFVCGQYGMFARSTDGGESFQKVDVGTNQCLQTILRGDGSLWTSGDAGAFRSNDDGLTWTKVDIEGGTSRPRNSDLGVLLPSSTGNLYLGAQGAITKTGLRAAAEIWSASTTPRGTLLAIGAGGAIWRSTDRGASFAAVDSGVGSSLENLVVTESGRVVIVGNDGVILDSHDDGVTFTRILQTHMSSWLFAVTAAGERVWVGGLDYVLEIVERRS